MNTVTSKEIKFSSYIHGGFECSSHIHNGVRLNLLESTGHLENCLKDYRQLTSLGITTVREGIAWNLVDGVNFDSLKPIVEAANKSQVEVIWDLCHYGMPDGLAVDSDNFVERFVYHAIGCAQYLNDNYHGQLMLCPFNEPSFLTKALGDFGNFSSSDLVSSNNHADIKKQLVKATIEATKAIKQKFNATFFHIDPLIHIAYQYEHERESVRQARIYQFESLDMVLGLHSPELGGSYDLVDVIGLNHYPYSNWLHGAKGFLPLTHQHYHSLGKQLAAVQSRYNKPLYLSETGVEGETRKEWLEYVLAECSSKVLGVCIYPITDYPGWGDDRHCPCGLLSYPNDDGAREVYAPLKEVVEKALDFS